jgi:hypothetical protein
MNEQISTRYEQWLGSRADARTREALREFTLALQSGAIQIAVPDVTPPLYAGGVNYCPNSDFKYSKMAIEVAGTTRDTAGDTNHECYRWYRQLQGDDLVLDAAHAVKAIDHSLFAAVEGANEAIPIWDRVNGWVSWGSDEDSPDLWDLAVRLYNNDIKPSDNWYIRFVLSALTEDLIPSDLEMYCGFWHETDEGQGWISGGNFVISHEIVGVKGTKAIDYLVVAKTDGGTTLYSETLHVTDAPDVINAANYVRVKYGDAAISGGFIEFNIYRHDLASGAFAQIGNIRNENYLVYDDQGRDIMPVNAFPTGMAGPKEAVAYSRKLQIGAFGGSFLINDFNIKIPDDYDWSATLEQSQFFRLGFTVPSAVNRQIRLDRVYIGPTFNVWSDSPFDPKDAAPSTSQTGGIPSAGGGSRPPGGGSGRCIRVDVPVLTLDLDFQPFWRPYEQIAACGDVLEAGSGVEDNVIREKQTVYVDTYYRVDLSNGVWIYCNRLHRLRLDQEGNNEAVLRLEVGDPVWGWTAGVEGPVTITGKMLIKDKNGAEFGTFALVGETSEGNHFYIAGFSEHGNSGVFNRNSKEEADPFIDPLLT